MVKDTVIDILDKLGLPYDDYCVNYIIKQLQESLKDFYTEEDIKTYWLWYVNENLFV